jgi:hypothetical protein
VRAGGAGGRPRRLAIGLSAVALAATAAACGLDVKGADLFLLTRAGGGAKLSLLVNDSGTISCDGASAKPLPDPLLLQARDLATSLDADAKAGLRIAQSRGSVYRFTVKLADGTIAFPDRAAARHPELARTELFAIQAATIACGSS